MRGRHRWGTIANMPCGLGTRAGSPLHNWLAPIAPNAGWLRKVEKPAPGRSCKAVLPSRPHLVVFQRPTQHHLRRGPLVRRRNLEHSGVLQHRVAPTRLRQPLRTGEQQQDRASRPLILFIEKEKSGQLLPTK